jgi:hypothetical protein
MSLGASNLGALLPLKDQSATVDALCLRCGGGSSRLPLHQHRKGAYFRFSVNDM